MKKVVKPAVMDPMGALRGWAFIFCFLSIGLTTRFRELKAVSRGALLAFCSLYLPQGAFGALVRLIQRRAA